MAGKNAPPMLKVLIAEDDLMMADMAEDVLVEHGYEVCGIARTVAEAVVLGWRHKPDLAVLDLRLADGGIGTEIRARLKGLERLGVLYASGNIANVALTAADGHASLSKPYRAEDLVRGLEIVTGIVSSGTASPPFPRGFKVLPPVAIAPRESEIDALAQVRKLLRQQAALAAFGSFALREGDLLKVLNEAARVCADGLSVPFSKVCRYRAAENDLLIEAGYGWRPGVVGHVVSPANESSPQGLSFVTGQPSICNDLRTENDFKLPPFYAEHGIISTVDVVIKGNGHPYGVLEIDNNEQHNYDQHDIDFLTGFANVLAEAVGTSSRMATLQATIAQMKTLVDEKDRLLDQKMVLAQELQHRVRNNLQLVYGMLSQQLGDTDDEAGQRGIKAIARRVTTLAQVYDHLLGSEMTRTTDFGGYVKSLCVSLAEIHGPPPGVTLTCESDAVVLDLDAVTALGIVVAELVTNSYDHAFPSGTGSITVSVRHTPGESSLATLSVFDNGTGFVAETNSKRHGIGLVRRLIEQIQGTVTVDAEHGTSWTIAIPR